MTPGEIAALITALFGGAIGRDVVVWVVRAISGREARRRSDADKAWAAYRRVKRKFHRMEDAYALARRMLHSAECVDPNQIPPWPEFEETGPIKTREE